MVMASLFRGRPSVPAAGPPLEPQLDALERQAAAASPGYETQFLTRAGNLCVEAGQPKRALGYYGRAIDAYLESGRFNAAEVLCQKLLRIAPDAVRARCTLAWLAIGKGYRSSVEHEVAQYVSAASRAGMEALAVQQLCMMSDAAPTAEVRELLGEHLLDLGEVRHADVVFARIHAERNGLRPTSPADQGTLWSRLLRASLMGPEELKNRNVAAGGDDGDDMPELEG